MNLSGECVLLRVYVGEMKKFEHRPLYEAIVLKAREAGLAGATVLRSPLGYGAASHLHSAKILTLSQDLPMVIEIVDTEEKITAFLPALETMMDSGLATTEKVNVVHHSHEKQK